MALTINNLERPLNKHSSRIIRLLNKQAIHAQDKPFNRTAKRFGLLKNIYLATEIKPNIEYKEVESIIMHGSRRKEPIFDLWYFKFLVFRDTVPFRVMPALAGNKNKITFKQYRYL